MTYARSVDTAVKQAGILQVLATLPGYPGVIWRNRYMVQNFFRRDLMGRFHGSFLGAWWMLVQPVFLFLVYYLIFGVLYRDPRAGEVEQQAFAVYLFSGVIVFHALVEATSTCCGVVVSNGNLVKKVAFPSEVLPIHIALVSMVIYMIGAIVCFGSGLAFGVLHLHWGLLYVPLVLLMQGVLIIGIGLFLANANVFIRDVSQLWRIFTMAWMFLSPVFWQPELLLKKFPDSPLPDLMFNLNPAYSLIQSHRLALGGENPEMGVSGFWGNFGVLSAWSVAFLLLGYTTFVASKHKYADVV